MIPTAIGLIFGFQITKEFVKYYMERAQTVRFYKEHTDAIRSTLDARK